MKVDKDELYSGLIHDMHACEAFEIEVVEHDGDGL